MARRRHDLLKDALELPLDERAELASDLLASLDEGAEEEIEAAWAAEIERRVRDVREGRVDSTDWRTVLLRVQKDVLGR